MISTAKFLVLLYVFFSFSIEVIAALKTCKPILSAESKTETITDFFEGEKETVCVFKTELPCEILKFAEILFVPE